MPKTRRRGLATTGELPGTLRRSSKEAQAQSGFVRRVRDLPITPARLLERPRCQM